MGQRSVHLVLGLALSAVLLVSAAWMQSSLWRVVGRDALIIESEDKPITNESHLANALYGAWDSLPIAVHSDATDRREPNKVLVNLIQPAELPAEDDVVMVTHTSGGRIENLVIQMRRWNGPAAISVYIKSRPAIQKILDQLVPELLSLEHTPQVHVIMENTTHPYPFNLVRNVALHNLQSDYFVAMDADFITNPNAHEAMSKLIRSNKEMQLLLRQRNMFVLPAFERTKEEIARNPTEPESWLPQTKQDVVEMREENKVKGFHIDVSQGGHKDTRYEFWSNTNIKKPFIPIKQNVDNFFEPYVLGYRHGVPPYWNGFRGYGFDKVSWFQELKRRGFRFHTLMDFFILHIDHPSTKDYSQIPLNQPEFDRFKQFRKDRFEQQV